MAQLDEYGVDTSSMVAILRQFRPKIKTALDNGNIVRSEMPALLNAVYSADRGFLGGRLNKRMKPGHEIDPLLTVIQSLAKFSTRDD